jgi:hypothetical protein
MTKFDEDFPCDFSNKHLQKYTKERIIEYVNTMSSDIQRNVDLESEDLESKEIIKLAILMSSVSDNAKPKELPLVLKIKSESDGPNSWSTNQANFK